MTYLSLQSFVDSSLSLGGPGTPFEFAFAPDHDLFLGNDNNGQVVKITLELIFAASHTAREVCLRVPGQITMNFATKFCHIVFTGTMCHNWDWESLL